MSIVMSGSQYYLIKVVDDNKRGGMSKVNEDGVIVHTSFVNCGRFNIPKSIYKAMGLSPNAGVKVKKVSDGIYRLIASRYNESDITSCATHLEIRKNYLDEFYGINKLRIDWTMKPNTGYCTIRVSCR